MVETESIHSLAGAGMRALVAEDDPVSARLIKAAIEPAGFVVEVASNGEDALELAKLYDFDIVVLDLRLPDMDGSEVVRKLRAADVRTPVLVLSGVDDRQEKVKALTHGADDYITKPFDKAELTARLQAIVRRSKGHPASVIRTGRLTLDLSRRTVEIDGRPLPVTGKEYGILELLSLRKGMTLTKEMFLDHLYGGMDEPEQKIVDVFICKLRKKIAAMNDGATPIETVWGRGYTLRDDVAAPRQVAEDEIAFDHELTNFALPDGDSLSELDLLVLTLLPH